MVSTPFPSEFTRARHRARLLPDADFAIAVALQRMATANGATSLYSLAPEANALLRYRAGVFIQQLHNNSMEKINACNDHLFVVNFFPAGTQ